MMIRSSKAPTLTLPCLQRPFQLEVDTLKYAIGAVLMQDGRPVAYHSMIFPRSKKSYLAYDKELLTPHQTIKHQRMYLLGKETIVYTNHRPLQYL